MMKIKTPYFFDGRLHFSKITLDALLKHGLKPSVAKVVRAGVNLDDRQTMRDLYACVQSYIETTPKNDPIAQGLADNEVQFMMTGQPTHR